MLLKKDEQSKVLAEEVKEIHISPVKNHVESRKIKIQAVFETGDRIGDDYIRVNVFGFEDERNGNPSYCLSRRYLIGDVKKIIEEKGYLSVFGHKFPRSAFLKKFL